MFTDGRDISSLPYSRQAGSWVSAQGGSAVIGEGQDLLALVGSLYDAATDPSLWEIALRRIAQSFGALGLFLCVLDMTSREVLLHLAYNPPPDDPPDGLWDGALPSLADTPSEHAVWRCPTAVRQHLPGMAGGGRTGPLPPPDASLAAAACGCARRPTSRDRSSRGGGAGALARPCALCGFLRLTPQKGKNKSVLIWRVS
jgi:hypothetical protein